MIFDNLRHDVRYAIRGLRLKPGFALAVVTTLGLGIGANAAMFGIVDRLLFRPPPLLKDPSTVHRVYLYDTYRGKESVSGVSEYVRYTDLAKWTTSFSRTTGYTERDLAVGVGEASREMPIGVVSASFFGLFDAPPALGRYFTDAEDQPPSGTAVAVLSYPMWQVQYGGRGNVLGTTIQIGPVIYTVIGVAAPGFVGLWSEEPPAAYIPITNYGSTVALDLIRLTRPWWETYSWGWMDMLVRRKPGVTIEAANADVTQAFLKSYRSEMEEHTRATPIEIARPHGVVASVLHDRGPNASSVAKVATWVAGMSVIVLLVACANVANLLLARALRRRREIAVRLALGIRRGRLLTQLLTESLLLGVLGGALGLVLAHWGGAALRAGLMAKSEAPTGLRDPRTVLYAAAAAVAVGLLTGLAPVLQARRADLTSDLKAGSREGTYTRSRARTGLLVLQGALSVLLLIGAGLFVRSLRNVRGVRLGYDVDPLMIVNLHMRGVQLDSARTVALRLRLLDAAREIPGVEHTSLETSMPFWSMWSTGLYVEGIDTVRKLGRFDLNAVSPDYFATVGTRLLRGRGITDQDVEAAPRVMVVSQAMGRVLWPDKDPIGQCIKVGADTMPCTFVVGVAENIKEQSLSADSGFYYYLSAAQWAPNNGGLFVRTRGDASRFQETVRKRLQQEMPGASYVTLTPFADILGPQTRSWQLGATMFVAFGGLALVLAAVGLYGVIAYNVTQRTHELGVRVALGAQGTDVVRLVVSDGLRIAGIGVAVGAAVALWGARWVEPLLFRESPRDPTVFGAVVLMLVGVAAFASWVPARRAARVDPNVALRTE